jgi:hypothetical protein
MTVKEFIKTYNFNIVNILLHVILIASFITILFFTYGVYIEKKVFEKQIDIFVEENLNSVKYLFPNLADKLKEKVKTLKFQNFDLEDKLVEENNNKIYKSAMYALTISIVVIAILIVLIYKFITPDEEKNGYIKKLLLYNVAAILVVGVTEIAFLTYFVGNYQSIDNNMIRKGAVDTIKNTMGYKISNITDNTMNDLLKLSSTTKQQIQQIQQISQQIQQPQGQQQVQQQVQQQAQQPQSIKNILNMSNMPNSVNLFQQNDPNLL